MNSVVQSFYNWYSSRISHPKYRWLIVLATLAYLFMPFDFLPDFLPVVGWIDDGMVLTILGAELSRLVLDYRNRRQRVQSPAGTEKVTVDVAANPQ